jgi:hypothetical protein
MPYFDFRWTDEIAEHLAEHDVTKAEFEEAVSNAKRRSISRSTGRPCCWGETAAGRQLFCVYENLDDMTIIPVTAYDVSD